MMYGIQNSIIKQLAAIPNLYDSSLISFSWLDISARVIMTKDDAAGLIIQEGVENLFRSYNRSGNNTLGGCHFLDHSVCFVEQKKSDPS
jgi:hypothetical protein